MYESNVSNDKLSREEIDRLGDDIAMAAAHIDAATHQLLSSIRRFAGRGRERVALRIG